MCKAEEQTQHEEYADVRPETTGSGEDGGITTPPSTYLRRKQACHERKRLKHMPSKAMTGQTTADSEGRIQA